MCRLMSEYDRVCEMRKLQADVGILEVMSCSRNDDATGISARVYGALLQEVKCCRFFIAHLEKKGGMEAGAMWSEGRV